MSQLTPVAGTYLCGDPRRRAEIASLIEAGATDLNAIDFLEVYDEPSMPRVHRQRRLFVHFVQDPTPLRLGPANVRIEGGERVRGIRVLAAETRPEPASGAAGPVLVVDLDVPGDFSVYTLRLVPTKSNDLAGLDPLLREVDFSFKVACPTSFDPAVTVQATATPAPPEPALDYLARDFNSLRRLMLDRMAVLAPTWTERNQTDLGVTLVELLAYVGDILSYRQDAVATEAYLSTCRLRTSARRHARLVDYRMHDGCNARTWVQVSVAPGSEPFTLSAATFTSAVPGLPAVMPPIPETAETSEVGIGDATRAMSEATVVFQQMQDAKLVAGYERLRFYTWGARECILPSGAVRATLRGTLAELEPGMVLVLEQALSPRTGEAADADIRLRLAVRLTEVRCFSTPRDGASAGPIADPLGGRFAEPPTGESVPVTEICWADGDALPFDLVIEGEDDRGRYVTDMAFARGNIVLADHGAWIEGEPLGVVPPGRFRPALAHGPVTQAAPLPQAESQASATALLHTKPSEAVPALILHDGTSQPWQARTDLLRSGSAKHVVLEVESSSGGAGGHIRLGDGAHGAPAPVGREVTARYRVGNGVSGNIGPGTLVHVITSQHMQVTGVSNPLPALGGVEPETIAEVRQRAPIAFQPSTIPGDPTRPDGRTLRRAVTPGDYAAIAEAAPLSEANDVQRATGTVRWRGSWPTVSVAVDRTGGDAVDPEFEAALRAHLEPYRMVGHDLQIAAPRPVALRIAMRVRVRPGYTSAHVRRTLMNVFCDKDLPGGRQGIFHPDRFTFGQTLHLSTLYAAAHGIAGVESVRVTAFERVGQPGPGALETGRLELGRLEAPMLSNDPNYPERGVFDLTMEEQR